MREMGVTRPGVLGGPTSPTTAGAVSSPAASKLICA